MNVSLQDLTPITLAGGPYMLGNEQILTMDFMGPAFGAYKVRTGIKAGEYFGIAFDMAGISKGMMEATKTRLESTKAKLEAGDVTGLTKDDLLGDLLFTTAMTYYAEYDAMDEVQARTIGVNRVRIPSEGIFKSTVKVNYVWGMASTVGAGGLVMDVDNNATMVGPRDGSRDKRMQFMRSSGMNSSTLEHSVPEQMYSTPESPAYGISAVKALSIAASQGIPIYTVTRANADTVIPQLQLDSGTIADIRNAVNAGHEVTVSKSFINYHGWIGCGYIAVNPYTGEGLYMIFGGENGGWVDGILVSLLVLLVFALLVLAVMAGPIVFAIVSLLMSIYISLLAWLATTASPEARTCAGIVAVSVLLGVLVTPVLAITSILYHTVRAYISGTNIGMYCFGKGEAY